jgi:hypothetical protein
MAAVIREVEVNINNKNDPSGHALQASLEASWKKTTWIMGQHEALPTNSLLAKDAANYPISGIRNITNPQQSLSFTPGMHISYELGHIMEKAIKTCARYGFILIDTNDELTARIVQEFMAENPMLKELGNNSIKGRSNMDAALGLGNQAYENYTRVGHTYTLIQCAVSIAWGQVPEEAKMRSSPEAANSKLSKILSNTRYWKDLNLFPKKSHPSAKLPMLLMQLKKCTMIMHWPAS